MSFRLFLCIFLGDIITLCFTFFLLGLSLFHIHSLATIVCLHLHLHLFMALGLLGMGCIIYRNAVESNVLIRVTTLANDIRNKPYNSSA